ncbi:MAG: glycosyltransferase family 39 protein [Candidatus Margulisiibacteriota bacterium]
MLTLLALSAVLYFLKLGSFSLYDAAETTYGEFVKNMVQMGNWLTLHYNAQVIFDKPPLYYWAVALISWLIGFNEWAMRLPAALAGVLTVLTTYLLGKKFYNERVGLLAGLIVMTAFQFLVQSRIAELDIVLTLFLSLSLLWFYSGYTTNDRRYYLAMYLPMALAILIKGLIGIALPGCAIFLFLLFKRETKKILELRLIPGLLIVLAIGLPWYAAEYYLHGQVFLDFALGFLFLARFGNVVAGHTGPPYYYFISILLGFAPYSQFLPLALWRSAKNWRNDPELLALAYIIPTFLVFSVAKTKLPSYLLPLFPFFAIMVAKLWADFIDDWKPEKEWKPANELRGFHSAMLFSVISLLVVSILIVLGFVIAGTSNYQMEYQAFLPILAALGAALFLGSFCALILFLIKRYELSFYSLPVMAAVVALILIFWALPLAEEYKGTKYLGREVAKVIQPDETIAAYETGNRPSVVFYNVKPVQFLSTEAEVKVFLARKKGYLFTAVGELKKIKKYGRIFKEKGELAVVI